MRRTRQTKIIATLGPSSNTPEMIEALFKTGVDVFRLNFSHGTHEDHAAVLGHIRAVEKKCNRPIGVIADLQGPKLRIGAFKNGAIQFMAGHEIRLDLDEAVGDSTRVSLMHPEIIEALEVGAKILFDDGRVCAEVIDKGADYLNVRIVSGTKLSDRKGVNIPSVVLPVSPLTEKDLKDLEFAVTKGVEWIALSFVQRAEDLVEARKLLAGRAGLIAKIEKPAAVDNLEELITLCDGLMIARGDLGVEIPAEDVPSLQKRMVRMVRRAGKPVIVATQMLESMVSSPSPTRAEASDVATAVYDGTDAVMLSAETAAGDYPIEAVSMMNRIAIRVEGDPSYQKIMDAEHPALQHTTGDAITAAARQVAKTIGATAIVTYTSSGSTTLRAARERPEVPILSLTSVVGTARRLNLSYGVHAVLSSDIGSVQEMVDKACHIALREEFAIEGQRLVITAGIPFFGKAGNTNALHVAWIKGPKV